MTTATDTTEYLVHLFDLYTPFESWERLTRRALLDALVDPTCRVVEVYDCEQLEAQDRG